MRIANGAATLTDVDNFTQFHLEADVPMSEVLSALGPLGQACDADHVWLKRDGVAEMAQRHDDQNWLDGFIAMCAYAQSKGWFNADGTHLRAHIARPTSPAPPTNSTTDTSTTDTSKE